MNKFQNYLKSLNVNLVITRSFSVSKKDIQFWHQGFSKDFPNGIISKNDFLNLFKQFFPFGDSKKFAEHVFTVMDLNQDHVVDFKEYLILLSRMTLGEPHERLWCNALVF